MMLVAIIFAVIVVLVIPIGFVMSTAIVAAALGALMKTTAERNNADSELLDTNY